MKIIELSIIFTSKLGKTLNKSKNAKGERRKLRCAMSGGWRVKQKLKWRNKGAFRLRAARLRSEEEVTRGPPTRSAVPA